MKDATYFLFLFSGEFLRILISRENIMVSENGMRIILQLYRAGFLPIIGIILRGEGVLATLFY